MTDHSHPPTAKKVLVAVGGQGIDAETVRLACRMTDPTAGRIYGVHIIEVNRALPLGAVLDEVVIIDRDPNQFSRAAVRGVLTNDFKGNQVVGNGTDADVLRRAGVEDADGFVAVTEGDNRNIMAAQIAKHIFKVPRVVCRIYDPDRADAYEKLGIHTICPTLEGAAHIEKTLMEK